MCVIFVVQIGTKHPINILIATLISVVPSLSGVYLHTYCLFGFSAGDKDVWVYFRQPFHSLHVRHQQLISLTALQKSSSHHAINVVKVLLFENKLKKIKSSSAESKKVSTFSVLNQQLRTFWSVCVLHSHAAICLQDNQTYFDKSNYRSWFLREVLSFFHNLIFSYFKTHNCHFL